jgi:ABC-type bacteriocin/lantibiotic exporter with double-glycine peptidase domain
MIAYRPGMTIVMVAHRPASLNACDTIVEVKQGRIVARPAVSAAAQP